jgi:hypothetical protein
LVLGSLTAERLAEVIGADPAQLRETLSSTEITQRLQEDADHAKACGVAATPGVFVEGKPIHTLSKVEIGFWDRLAESYWQRIGVERPDSTRPAAATATPDSPSPKAAP